MISVLSVLLLAVAVNCQSPVDRYRPDDYYGPPQPYAFNFNNVLDDGIGRIARTETSDGSGRVQGSYSLANDEGHTRVVEYVADQDGFRAFVRTNEPGTDNQNPADVVIESSSPYANRNYQGYNPVNPIGRRPTYAAGVPQPATSPVAPENLLPADLSRPPVIPRTPY